jgi:hypothetical protein
MEGPWRGDDGVTTVEFGGDRGRVVVRPVRRDDRNGLVALYEGLDAEDRHHRFFAAYRPPPEWFDRLVDVESSGGARLVAEHSTATTSSIVAEAGYSRLPNGNGDFAIVVERSWRGWLGPHLVARLLEVAASKGVPNLEADVLTTNGPMLSILRHRGAVVVEHDGWSSVRLRVGSGGETATWSGADVARRVLVETPGGRWPGEDAARAAGLEVLTCSGPDALRKCPALKGRNCPLVSGADAVVVRSRPGDSRWDELIAAHRAQHPDLAVVLEDLGRSGTKDADLVRRVLSQRPADQHPLKRRLGSLPS